MAPQHPPRKSPDASVWCLRFRLSNLTCPDATFRYHMWQATPRSPSALSPCLSPLPECPSPVAMATILVSPTTPSRGSSGFSPVWLRGPGRGNGGQAGGSRSPMAMNFQENVTLAMAVFTILASIYFFNKAQH
nr:uncharacterized LOC105372440 homolog [Saimiri boliviensis boliviensis]